MRIILSTAFFHLLPFHLLLIGQVTEPREPAVSVEEIVKYISVPGLPKAVEQTIEAVKLNGLGFELNEKSLSDILAAAAKGRRSPIETSKLVLQIMQACADCRNRYFGPLSKDQLLSILNNKRLRLPPHIILQEVQLRGTKDTPKSFEFVEELKLAGASPELIDLVVPDDELEIPVPIGYKREPLLRAPNYDRKLSSGVLLLRIKIIGKIEFYFKHNSLFTKALAHNDKKLASKVEVLESTFTSPVPKTEGGAQLTYEDLERRGGSRNLFGQKKVEKDPKTPIAVEQSDGGFRFSVNEPDKEPHTYDIRVAYGLGKPSLPEKK